MISKTILSKTGLKGRRNLNKIGPCLSPADDTIKLPYYKVVLSSDSLVVLATFGDPGFDIWEPLFLPYKNCKLYPSMRHLNKCPRQVRVQDGQVGEELIKPLGKRIEIPEQASGAPSPRCTGATLGQRKKGRTYVPFGSLSPDCVSSLLWGSCDPLQSRGSKRGPVAVGCRERKREGVPPSMEMGGARARAGPNKGQAAPS